LLTNFITNQITNNSDKCLCGEITGEGSRAKCKFDGAENDDDKIDMNCDNPGKVTVVGKYSFDAGSGSYKEDYNGDTNKDDDGAGNGDANKDDDGAGDDDKNKGQGGGGGAAKHGKGRKRRRH